LRAEAAEDCVRGFDLVHGNGSARNGFEEVAEKNCPLMFRKLFEGGEFSGFGSANVRVESANDFGRGGVEFCAFAEAIEAGVGEFGGRGRKGRRMHAEVIGEKVVESF
jgi:hypothetical protein